MTGSHVHSESEMCGLIAGIPHITKQKIKYVKIDLQTLPFLVTAEKIS
jgi:hypothetical protein